MSDTEHRVFESGLKKEATEKVRYDLIPVELLTRIAAQFTHGAKKYGEGNWKLGKGQEIDIFRQAAHRHFFQWANGVEDGEDHAAALLTDVIMYEYLSANQPITRTQEVKNVN